MNIRTKMAARSALTLLAFALVPALTRAQTTQDGAREFYAGIESVYLRASVDVTIQYPLYEGHQAPVRGVGIVEHWEGGDRFRTVVWVDPKLGAMMNLEIAFDGGQHFQVNFLDSHTLTHEQAIFRGGLIPWPTPVPNPFYLPVKYLVPSDDECLGCQLTLAFVKRDDSWSRISLSADTGPAVVEMVGGERGGEPYNIRLHRAPTNLEAKEPTMGGLERIDRVGIDTFLRESVVFSEFEAGFPRTIRLSGYEPDKADAVVVVDYEIEELVLNPDLGDAVFTIAPGGGARIWEQGSFVGVSGPPEE